MDPSNNKDEICAQIYFKDEDEIKLRQKYSIGLNALVILQIQAMLSDNKNPFISQFKTANTMAKCVVFFKLFKIKI